jgi:hypothetical protein
MSRGPSPVRRRASGLAVLPDGAGADADPLTREAPTVAPPTGEGAAAAERELSGLSEQLAPAASAASAATARSGADVNAVRTGPCGSALLVIWLVRDALTDMCREEARTRLAAFPYAVGPP